METELRPPTLRDALALLGDWDADADALQWLPSPIGSPSKSRVRNALGSVASSGHSAYRRKREAYESTRRELLAQVAALESVLREEKSRFPLLQQVRTGDALALSREWENMAASQRKQRRRSEKTNTALRELYVAQRKTAQQMARLLRRALAIQRPLGMHLPWVSLEKYRGPTVTIAKQLEYLERLHGKSQSSTWFPVICGSGDEEFRDVSFRDDGFSGIQVQFAASWELPFGVNRVADALWAQITRMQHRGRHVDHENTRVLVSSFVSAPQSHDMPGCNHGQIIEGATHGQTALRRFEQSDNASVFLISANQAVILDNDGKPKGSMSGDGWIQVEPRSSSSTATTPEACRVRWCHRINGRPHGYDSASRDERARWVYSAVTGPMKIHWEKNLDMNIQAVENALLQAH